MFYKENFAVKILVVYILFSICVSRVHANTDSNTICTIRIDAIEALTTDRFLNNNDFLKQWFRHKYPTCQYNSYEVDNVDVHANTDSNKICTIRIDVIEALTKDGFLNNNDYLKQWFRHKYPTCQYNNYKMDNVDYVNVKHNSKPEQDDMNTNFQYDRKYGNEVGIKVTQKMLNKRGENKNSNEVAITNNINKDATLGVFDPRRDMKSGRSLIGEWDGSATSGTFRLSNDKRTSNAISVNGRLEIIGIITMNGMRPAIDAGGDHSVFYVGNNDELILSNLTIKNGFVSIYIDQQIYIICFNSKYVNQLLKNGMNSFLLCCFHT